MSRSSDPSPRLRKRLGQHHLIRAAALAPLLDFLRPEGERVVEIGPGGGVLTRQLLSRGARVLAIERDPAWAFHLAGTVRPAPPLVVADALRLDWGRLRRGTLVAGNLPYNIATPLIEALLPCHERVPRAAFLVQLEVAERLVAAPRDPGYGALSVLVRSRAEVRLLGRVRAGAFRPPPRVDGAFVGLELRSPLVRESQMPRFERVVKAAFEQRRKMLRNSLAEIFGADVGAVLEGAGIDPRARPEQLDLDAFRRLAEPRT